MTFLGLEKPVEYQSQSVFNPATAQMVLGANKDYINAIYNDYLQSKREMKEFNEKYGDFLSPIQKDMDWYEQNVTGRLQNFINDLYAKGIDPLRSVEGRAMVSREIANMPYKGISNVRQSAIIANKFLDSIERLKEKGLYNPETAALEAKALNEYSTMGGDGIWTTTGVTPYQNMAEFSKDYFDNIKPFERSMSKNGISYKVSEINENDLHNIADAHFNDLVNTAQGQLMYKLLKNKGLDDQQARQAFNDMVVSGNRDRLYYSDDYDDNYFKRQQLALQAESNKLAREKFNYEKQKDAAEALERNGVSQWEQNYNDALANAASDGYTKYDPSTINQHYESIGKIINSQQKYFGSELKNDAPWVRDQKFENRYTKPVDVISILQAHGGYKEGESSVLLNRSDISRLRSEEDVITNTQGNYSRRTHSSKKIQNEVSKALKDGDKEVRMYPHGTKYGAQSKDNTFDIDAKVDIIIVDANGDVVGKHENVYWDTRWGNRETLNRPSPMPANPFRSDSSEVLDDTTPANAYPTTWWQSSVLPADTRGTKADYSASPSVKLGTSYK